MASTANTVPFPITVFYDSSGAPLSNGYVTIYLTADAAYSSSYPSIYPHIQLCSGLALVVDLDINGSMVEVPQVYQCSELFPSDVEYMLTSYTSVGEKVSGPDFITV